MIRLFTRFAVLALATVSILAACTGGSGDHHAVQIKDAVVTLEGPLFAGPNQGQYAFKLDLAKELGSAYTEGMTVESARITAVEVASADSLGLSSFRSFVVSLASDNADVAMQEAAFKNPLPEGASRVSLDVSPEAELGSLLQQGTVYLVLDADLAEDYLEGSRSLTLNLSFDITIKS